MKLVRASGILLHPTSLPGPWGVGDMGPPAYRFVDWLRAAGQSWWQMLPLGPTGFGNSPYMCFSAFAGNPLLLSPERLAADGLLDPGDLTDRPAFPPDRVPYAQAIRCKRALLTRSFTRFLRDCPAAHRDGWQAFRAKQAAWLEDYALFMALKEVQGDGIWTDWPAELRARRPQALREASRGLRHRIEYHQYLQYLFFRQWSALRQYAHRRGVRLIGDLPIYLAHDSAEVWAHPDMFYLNRAGRPTVIAGVPPDYFSATGQRWGNPIYRWDLRARDGFPWWVDRFRANLALVDLLRLDHFRGFEAYWEIPAAEPTAINGRWVKGPGAALFQTLRDALGGLPVIAEDLGVITPEVEALRDEFGLPGMRILQMAFGRDPKGPDYRPHNHIRHAVVYTATHDHNTTVGWFTAEPGSATTQSLEEVHEERAVALRYLGGDGREIHWDMIRLAMGSVAALAIVPLQDVLGLDGEARMNLPGTLKGNWEWRTVPDPPAEKVGERLRDLTGLYDRLPAG